MFYSSLHYTVFIPRCIIYRLFPRCIIYRLYSSLHYISSLFRVELYRLCSSLHYISSLFRVELYRLYSSLHYFVFIPLCFILSLFRAALYCLCTALHYIVFILRCIISSLFRTALYRLYSTLHYIVFVLRCIISSLFCTALYRLCSELHYIVFVPWCIKSSLFHVEKGRPFFGKFFAFYQLLEIKNVIFKSSLNSHVFWDTLYLVYSYIQIDCQVLDNLFAHIHLTCRVSHETWQLKNSFESRLLYTVLWYLRVFAVYFVKKLLHKYILLLNEFYYNMTPIKHFLIVFGIKQLINCI